MGKNVLYADFEVNSDTNDMFVVTPEGNYYNFPGDEFTECHEPIDIIDTKSHKIYKVYFNE